MEKEICAICGSDDTAPWFGDDDRVYRCRECDTVALAKRLHIQDLDAYYGSNQVYSLNVERAGKIKAMVEVANEYLDVLMPYVNPTGKKFLDIGANQGALVQEAARRGFSASGLEMNRQLVEEAKKHGLDLTDEDLASYARHKKLDVVAMMHVLEHIPDPRRTVKDVHTALVPGGLFLIEVPDIESYPARHDRLSWKYIAREHLFYFSPATLAKLLAEEGFDVLLTRTRNHFIKGLSLRNLLRYLTGKRVTRDRFFMKQASASSEDAPAVRRGPLFHLLKRALVAFIHLLRRGDFVLILARKKPDLPDGR